MAFSYSSKEITIVNGILHAQCVSGNGNWFPSSLDLNPYIGNDDGAFSIPKPSDVKGYSKSAQDETYSGNGWLYARLLQRNNIYVAATIYLDKYIRNSEGQLEWIGPISK